MLLVRPNLTELLLEVTNEEIEIIAKDVFTKTRMKGQTEYINIQNHVEFIFLKKNTSNACNYHRTKHNYTFEKRINLSNTI